MRIASTGSAARTGKMRVGLSVGGATDLAKQNPKRQRRGAYTACYAMRDVLYYFIRVVQKLQFLNNNRLKIQMAFRFYSQRRV
jgi:hypothetical protein